MSYDEKFLNEPVYPLDYDKASHIKGIPKFHSDAFYLYGHEHC